MRRRARAPRVTPGARRATETGAELELCVLGRTASEWIAADLATGALVRCETSPGADGEAPDVAGRGAVVRVRLGEPDPVRDPARAEALVIERAPEPTGTLSSRQLRRLLRGLAAPVTSPGVVLSRPGPSLAYVDLAPDVASVALVDLGAASVELTERDGSCLVALGISGATQVLPVLDPDAARAARAAAPRGLRGKDLGAALGYRVGYGLVGLGPVRAGHAQKVCFALLPR